MTLEDFAHRCLMIKAGNAELAIPCCANCKYYQRVWDDALPAIWVCKRIDPHWINDMKPEDFCSRWESRNEGEIICQIG